MTILDIILKIRDITFPTKVCIVKTMVFPVVMYTCESWTIKKAEHQRTGVFELWYWRRLLRVPWTARRPNQSILMESHSKDWIVIGIFIGRTDTEVPTLWLPDAKSQLTGKDPVAGKDRRQEDKGMTEGKMVGWHHWLNGHAFKQVLRDGEGQGNLTCFSPQECKKSDTTEQLNNKSRLWFVTELLELNRENRSNIQSSLNKGTIRTQATQWRKESIFNKQYWKNWMVICKNSTPYVLYIVHKN